MYDCVCVYVHTHRPQNVWISTLNVASKTKVHAGACRRAEAAEELAPEPLPEPLSEPEPLPELPGTQSSFNLARLSPLLYSVATDGLACVCVCVCVCM